MSKLSLNASSLNSKSYIVGTVSNNFNLSDSINDFGSKFEDIKYENDSNTSAININLNEINILEAKISSNTNSISNLKQSINDNSTSLNTITLNINSNKNIINNLKTSVSSNTTSIGTITSSNSLNISSIGNISASNSLNISSLNNLTNPVTSNTYAIANISTSISSNITSLNNLTNSISSNTSSIANISTSNSSNINLLNNLKPVVTSNTILINSLTSDVLSNISSINSLSNTNSNNINSVNNLSTSYSLNYYSIDDLTIKNNSNITSENNLKQTNDSNITSITEISNLNACLLNTTSFFQNYLMLNFPFPITVGSFKSFNFIPNNFIYISNSSDKIAFVLRDEFSVFQRFRCSIEGSLVTTSFFHLLYNISSDSFLSALSINSPVSLEILISLPNIVSFLVNGKLIAQTLIYNDILNNLPLTQGTGGAPVSNTTSFGCLAINNFKQG